jgi:hypothetical protein
MTRLLFLSASIALGSLVGLAGCGPVDEHVAGWCKSDPDCTCDDNGENCCIVEGGACYDGQCCEGFVCSDSGRCVAE